MTQTIETLIGNRPLRLVGFTQLRPGLLLAGVFVGLLLLAAVVPQWLAPYDPLEASARMAFQAPSNVHWLGTDENGRDVLSRLI